MGTVEPFGFAFRFSFSSTSGCPPKWKKICFSIDAKWGLSFCWKWSVNKVWYAPRHLSCSWTSGLAPLYLLDILLCFRIKSKHHNGFYHLIMHSTTLVEKWKLPVVLGKETCNITGRHNLRSFLAAYSTQNYFLIARMLSFLWHSRQKCRI